MQSNNVVLNADMLPAGVFPALARMHHILCGFHGITSMRNISRAVFQCMCMKCHLLRKGGSCLAIRCSFPWSSRYMCIARCVTGGAGASYLSAIHVSYLFDEISMISHSIHMPISAMDAHQPWKCPSKPHLCATHYTIPAIIPEADASSSA